MKNIENHSPKAFKGAGILIGIAIGVASAVVIYAFTENMGMTLSLGTALGIPMGYSFERNFQGYENEMNPKMQKFLLVFLVAGVVLFSVTYFISKLV